MYEQNVTFLSSIGIQDKAGYSGVTERAIGYSRAVHDGVVFADDSGNTLRMRIRPSSKHVGIVAAQMQPKDRTIYRKFFSGILAERITTYLEEFYEKRKTNCASFVEYLRSGNFFECDPEFHSMMFKGNLATYQGEKVRPGDSVCVLYFSQLGKRRRYGVARTLYRKNRKAEGNLTRLSVATRRSFAPEKMIEFYTSGIFSDYHFMYCIDIHNGMPVFIQQVGRNDPRMNELQHTPLLVSIGMQEMAYSEVQAFVFINRKK